MAAAFLKKIDENNVTEILEWQTQLNKEGATEDRLALNSFAKELTRLGWTVDQNGYDSMFRVRISQLDPNSKSLQSLIDRIPVKHLKYTFNLDYIDIYIKGAGKLSSVEWLTAYLSQRNKNMNDYTDQCQSPASSSTTTAITTSLPKNDFVFMGDDTNDIEIASRAKLAFIVMPCSDDMQNWMNGQADIARDAKEEESDMLDWLDAQNDDIQHQHGKVSSSLEDLMSESTEVLPPLLRPIRVTNRLYTAPVNGFRGTEANLAAINSLLRLKQNESV